ncbi:MAG: redoxin family protein [Acetobacteraceae bacterium]
MASGTFDPRGVPSPIIGHPVPDFTLPSQAPGQGFSSAELASGKPLLLNFFASWCVPCVEEHPALMALSKAGVPILGDCPTRTRRTRSRSSSSQHGKPVCPHRAGPAGAGGDRLGRLGRAGDLPRGRQGHRALALARPAGRGTRSSSGCNPPGGRSRDASSRRPAASAADRHPRLCHQRPGGDDARPGAGSARRAGRPPAPLPGLPE